MKKGIRNADAVAHKLGLALIRTINEMLKVAKKKMQKNEKMMEK